MGNRLISIVILIITIDKLPTVTIKFKTVKFFYVNVCKLFLVGVSFHSKVLLEIFVEIDMCDIEKDSYLL